MNSINEINLNKLGKENLTLLMLYYGELLNRRMENEGCLFFNVFRL
jgi:hypothetical protein